MNKQLNETIGAMEYDGLICGAAPHTDVFSVTIAGQTVPEGKPDGEAVAVSDMLLKRGTVLARKTDGKMEVLGTGTSGAVANCILADDVVLGTVDITAVAYRTGHFSTNKLIVADEYTLSADDKEELRKAGILLSDVVGI